MTYSNSWRLLGGALTFLLTTLAHAGNSAVYVTYPAGSYIARDVVVEVVREPIAGGDQAWLQSSSLSGGGSISTGLTTQGPQHAGKAALLSFSRGGAKVQAIGAGQCITASPALSQCWLPYAWRAGVVYRVRVQRGAAGWWEVALVDASRGTDIPFARFWAVTETSSLGARSTHRFEDAAACAAMTPQQVIWHAPSSRHFSDPEGKAPVAPELTEVAYDSCPQTVTTCDTEHRCLITVSES